MKISIPERNRQILQMLREGMRRVDVARKSKLSPSRIHLIEKGDRAEKSMGERRNKLREEIRAADDPDKMWPVNDMVDAIGLIVMTRKPCSKRAKKTVDLQVAKISRRIQRWLEACKTIVCGLGALMASP